MTYCVLEDEEGWKIQHNDQDYTGYKSQHSALQSAINIARVWGQKGHEAEVQMEEANGARTTVWAYDPDSYPPLGFDGRRH